jgi:translation initiation factor 1
MASDKWENARPVYSTEGGRVRRQQGQSPNSPAPASDDVVRVSRTKAGRKGKTVTLVTGLPPGDLAGVARELKRLCGSGGAVKAGVVELQGDHRERVAAHLRGRYRVKLAGG